MTDLDANHEGHGGFKEAQQLVRKDGHEEAVPGEGAQQGDEGQHTGAEQANVGAEHHHLLLQQRPCISQATRLASCCMCGAALCRVA